MKKNTINHLVEKLPDLSDFIFEKIKDTGVTYDDAKGLTGICLKIFAKPITDKFLEAISDNKLENFGFATYVKAGLSQGNKSIESLDINADYDPNATVIMRIEDELSKFKTDYRSTFKIMNFDVKENTILNYIKDLYKSVFIALNIADDKINAFLNHYNKNIESSVKEAFGDGYNSHLEDIEKNYFDKTEIKFLNDMISLSKIGFKDDENFEYKTTYAKWEKVYNFRKNEVEEIEQSRYVSQEDKKHFENGLSNINELINEYFKDTDENYLNKILFIVSDFGKGKSVFMKNFASRLAKEYLNTFEGYFPVYFNLRDYASYISEDRLGVIKYFLHSKYGIDISSDYYKKKKFIFLMDGLDESGELSTNNINNVIQNIKKIQELDMSNSRKNRIIITSRPINEGLKENLEKYEPYTVKENDNDISCYISIYGFRKYQFNDFIRENITKYKKSGLDYTGFSEEIIKNIKTGSFDFYDEFIKKNLLSVSELRRPIFSYMIVQLVINNLDINSLGKIGIYMSFLNLLTKEAKHHEDSNYKVNLEEEFIFRDTLHSIASLWMAKKSNGEQGVLKKLEICSAILGCKAESINQSKEISCFNFLSHSYFGEEGDTLHFQHQSFAEILLAEYYLKLFIKFALEDNLNIHEIRAYLSLGEPTEQTIQFFKELLQMLKDCAESATITDDIKNRRKMLAPIIASMAVSKNAKVHSPDIKYTWYKSCNPHKNLKKLPEDMILDWPIKENEISKIVDLCQNIMESRGNFIPLKASVYNSIYDREALFFSEPIENKLTNMDKWLAMLVGNLLKTNIKSQVFFNEKISWTVFAELIKQRQFTNLMASPSWMINYFKGINFEIANRDHRFADNTTTMSQLNLTNMDFSYSNFKNFYIENSNLSDAIFNNCTICQSSLAFCHINSTSFHNITLEKSNGSRFLEVCTLIQSIVLPHGLESLISKGSFYGYSNYVTSIKFSNLDGLGYDELIEAIDFTLKPLFKAAVNNHNDLTMQDFKKFFEIDIDLNKKLKDKFESIFID